ncbi:MAG: cellulase family glycosylhydrolase [Rubrobacter sp.]|nr:cellulase family glycosylhydrolase [Rubrobacter sp.]
MAPKKSEAPSKGKRLLIATATAVLIAALAIAVTQLTPNQIATTTFDYTLPVNSAELDDTQLTKALDVAKAAGVNSVSSGAVWWYLNEGQPSPRSYDWSSLDRLVNAAETRGMTVKLQLSGTPDWVHPDLENSVPNPSDRIWYPPRGSTELGYWSDFVNDVVSRYKGRVVQYEMWNEPNIEDFWKPSPKPDEYVALLRAGYLSVKNAYPGASVVFGGLNRNDLGYLDAYYWEAKKYLDAAVDSYFFDIMDVHPYSSIPSATTDELQEPISPDRDTSSAVFDGIFGTVDQNFLGIKKIKSAMDDQGDAEKSIFLGEYGFSTTDTWMKAVPDYRRALYLKRAYILARNLPYITGMSWYSYYPTSPDKPEWSIVGTNLSETMTFRALKQTTGAEPGGATVTLPRVPNARPISGIYRVNPTVSNLGPTSNWEFYVDGVLQGVYERVPFDWNTSSVPDGFHTLMVAAYTREGSVWPSNMILVNVANVAESRNRGSFEDEGA